MFSVGKQITFVVTPTHITEINYIVEGIQLYFPRSINDLIQSTKRGFFPITNMGYWAREKFPEKLPARLL